ncbi:MAG: prepilin-type N-terminal cleavage/methylation domain-containing protein [Pedosphaera parvula]|nr:prepilin-type N-terminal cleavage/methylation domain-containing protein [Pedosphaera parvula]
MNLNLSQKLVSRGCVRGFTLAEVVIAAAIGAISIGGIIYGYVMSAQRAEWAAYAMAAQSLAMQRIEQTRAAKWDLESTPNVDQVVSANFPDQINILDVPISGTNVVYATNFTTITTVSASPPLRSIQVDCVWNWNVGGRLFTNTVVTYRSPDN